MFNRLLSQVKAPALFSIDTYACFREPRGREIESLSRPLIIAYFFLLLATYFPRRAALATYILLIVLRISNPGLPSYLPPTGEGRN
jgi:hypothetical protein